MRIAILPLDSRPANYVLPQRLCAIARAEQLLPPRELLGTLHRGGDREALLAWLVAASQEAQALVLSWDALVYGGLVQSRSDGSKPLALEQLEQALSGIDWRRCVGHLYVVLPRLGITVADSAAWELHRRLGDYFTTWGKLRQTPQDDALAARLRELEDALGPDALARAWALRRRNTDAAAAAIRLAARLGLRGCHIAVEDNAPSGPHLQELAELRQLADEALREQARDSTERTRFTFFDGADECAALLTARALLDGAAAPPQPVRLTLFPASPGPENYTGLFESQSLDAGLQFLSRYLDLPFRSDARAQWLVCYGKQPQPDAFATGPAVFNNPYLLPTQLDGAEPLFVADLAACNGGNPHLAVRLGELAGARLRGYSAWNTNFNALGFSAATLAVSCLPDADPDALRRLLLERLADDVAYQSIARPEVLQRCRMLRLDPLDFGDSGEGALAMLELVCRESWRAWAAGPASGLMHAAGFSAAEIEAVGYSFPWQRAFETEVHS